MKKITVKHELNTAIGDTKSPIYVRVRYESKTTRYKSLWPLFFKYTNPQKAVHELEDLGEFFTKEKYEELQSGNGDQRIAAAVRQEEEAVRATIKYFIEKHNVNIIGAGISGIVTSVRETVDQLLLNQMAIGLMDDMYKRSDQSPSMKPLFAVAEMIDWNEDFSTIMEGLSFMARDEKSETRFFRFLKPYLEKMRSIDALVKMDHDKKIRVYEWLTDEDKKSYFNRRLYKVLSREQHQAIFAEIESQISTLVELILKVESFKREFK